MSKYFVALTLSIYLISCGAMQEQPIQSPSEKGWLLSPDESHQILSDFIADRPYNVVDIVALFGGEQFLHNVFGFELCDVSFIDNNNERDLLKRADGRILKLCQIFESNFTRFCTLVLTYPYEARTVQENIIMESISESLQHYAQQYVTLCNAANHTMCKMTTGLAEQLGEFTKKLTLFYRKQLADSN